MKIALLGRDVRGFDRALVLARGTSVTGRFKRHHAAFVRELELGHTYRVAWLEAVRAGGTDCRSTDQAAAVEVAGAAHHAQFKVAAREYMEATGGADAASLPTFDTTPICSRPAS